jgi:hypothetical protein
MALQGAGGLATATNAANAHGIANNGAHQFNYAYSDGSEEEVDSE